MHLRIIMTALLLGLLITTTQVQSQPKTKVDLATCWANVIPPTKKAALVRWLNNKSYKDTFIPEPAPHPSLGPHSSTVLTYYNPILAGDLRANQTVFRKGAAMVKEFLNGNTVSGYAVMVKKGKHTKSRGKDWLFYESFNLQGSAASYGKGIGICTGCHGGQGNVDYLLSAFRP